MMLIVMGIVFIMMGYMLLAVTEMFPILKMIYLGWIASILFIAPWIYSLYRMWIADTFINTDVIPIWKTLTHYLRRDNEIIPLVGERAFTGESFIDIPQLGLVETLGRDTVYTWGDKKTVFALENVPFTPDPRYFNYTYTLWELGFSNSDDLKKVLLGEDLYLMGVVYQNMEKWDSSHGGERLMNDMVGYDGKTKSFKPSFWQDMRRKYGRNKKRKRR